jgi:hypothetical protein
VEVNKSAQGACLPQAGVLSAGWRIDNCLRQVKMENPQTTKVAAGKIFS